MLNPRKQSPPKQPYQNTLEFYDSTCISSILGRITQLQTGYTPLLQHASIETDSPGVHTLYSRCHLPKTAYALTTQTLHLLFTHALINVTSHTEAQE